MQIIKNLCFTGRNDVYSPLKFKWFTVFQPKENWETLLLLDLYEYIVRWKNA